MKTHVKVIFFDNGSLGEKGNLDFETKINNSIREIEVAGGNIHMPISQSLTNYNQIGYNSDSIFLTAIITYSTKD